MVFGVQTQRELGGDLAVVGDRGEVDAEVGYRLRPELAAGYDTIATLASATARGLILMALSTPELATHQTTAKPFGATETRDWSLLALGLASIASAFLEPDPTVSWTDERIGAIRHSIDDLQLPGPADPTAPTAGPPGS